ncbi:MAG: metallophosphoesterase [Gammaproteobacteria bacterium]|nr:metallophosphoesterase [Gammaproteobacteria bacterium]
MFSAPTRLARVNHGIYAIGDIQGCYREFRDLLDECSFETGTDTLWLVGDLVNRGPDNLNVLRFVMNTPGVRTVLGNHDLHFLAVAYGYAEQVAGTH